MNILVTQVSKMGSLCWIKCLKRIQNISIKLYGTDCNPLGYTAGSQMVDTFFQHSSKFSEEEYLMYIHDLCKKLEINLLLIVMDDELDLFLKNHSLFRNILFGPTHSVFSIFHNKYIASQSIEKLGIQIPQLIENPFGEKKVIFRDKIGIGSQGIYIVDLEKEQYIENRFQSNRFMQKYIEGDEYTVDVLTDITGDPLIIVPRKRLEIRQGISFRCQLINDAGIIDACKKIYKNHIIPGISNVQFIKNDSGIYFIELNPRLGGSSIASVIAGFNYTELFIRHFVENKIPKTLEDYQMLFAWDSIISRDYHEYVYIP